MIEDDIRFLEMSLCYTHQFGSDIIVDRKSHQHLNTVIEILDIMSDDDFNKRFGAQE